jgi:hypothetical protein
MVAKGPVLESEAVAPTVEVNTRCVFKLFDEDDWEGYAAYLTR